MDMRTTQAAQDSKVTQTLPGQDTAPGQAAAPAHPLTQRFIDQLPGTAFLKDSSLRLLMINRYLANILGIDPQSAVGKTCEEIFPPDFAANLRALDEQVLAQGKSQTFFETYLNRHFETHMFLMNEPNGERLLGGLSMDVTDRFNAAQRTQALLKLNELGNELAEQAFLTAGLELAQEITHSQIGFLHFVNDDQETLELVTWTAGALRGCTAAHDNHYPISHAGIWADCFRNKAPVVFNDYATYTQKRGLPEGHAPLLRLISVPVMEGSKVRMMLGVGNKATHYDDDDVTTLQLIGNDLWRIASRGRAKLALQQRVDELAQANQKLSRAHVQLLQAEKMIAVGQLAAGVAHEVNNPMGFVKSNIGALGGVVSSLLDIVQAYRSAQTTLDPQAAQAFAQAEQLVRAADLPNLTQDATELVQESQEGVDRVSQIVRRLRDFAQPNDTDWADTNLHACMDGVLELQAPQMAGKVTVTRQYGTLPDVMAQTGQLNQVLWNLVQNAIQAMNGTGQLQVRTGTTDGQVWMELQDSGSGIAPEHLPHVFDPFFTTKPVGQASGMGLAVAWAVVARHQGQISVTSELGVGTTFRLSLPTNPMPAAQDAPGV